MQIPTAPFHFFSTRAITLAVCGVVLFSCGLLNAYDKSVHLTYDKSKGVEIEITTPYENVPSTGFVPLEIRIGNYSGRTVNYELSSQAGYYGGSEYSISFSQKFSVPHETTKVFSIYVPVPNLDDHSYYNPGVYTFSGYAINNAVNNLSLPSNNTGGGKDRSGFMLVSQEIALTSWEPTRQTLDSKGESLYGSSIKPGSLPKSWLGFMGVGSIWIAEADWSEMAPESREAIKEWIMQGGHLFIASRNVSAFHNADLGIKATGSDISTFPLWLGSVTLLPWDGKSNLLLPSIQNSALENLLNRNQLNIQISKDYIEQPNSSLNWPLLMKIPGVEASGILILIFMVAFAVIVGPVNLFVFAREPFRFRLFWTTPLISLITSLLLGGLILIKDGIGAVGEGLTLIYLPAGENRVVHVQEQCSLSGLLLNRQFKMEEPVFLAMLKLDNSYRQGQVMNVQALKTYSGDWFASRSVNGHLLIRVNASRARVELTNQPPFSESNPPQIVTSVEYPLDEFFFVDDKNQYWKAPLLTTGQNRVLSPSTAAEFNEFMAKFSQKAGSRVKSLMQNGLAQGRKNNFYASCASPEKQLIPTLRSIRWQSATAYVMGEITGTEKIPDEIKVPATIPPDIQGQMNKILGEETASAPTNSPPAPSQP